MLKRFVFALYFLVPVASAAQLPDFTELVEKQGPTVVNISTTQSVKSPVTPQIPNLPENFFAASFRIRDRVNSNRSRSVLAS
jgi:S1-C subfamily serine protease